MRDGPAASHVRTLQALDDLSPPGSAWSRFSAADGLLLLVRHAYTQQQAERWQQAVVQVPAQVRRLLVRQQETAAQKHEQGADVSSSISVGSSIVAGLAASACLGGLQQLAMDAPVSTAEVDVLLSMLSGLQQLDLGQVLGGSSVQLWQPAALPSSMQSVRLKCDWDAQGYAPVLDVSRWASAKFLCCLQLRGPMNVAEGLGLLACGQLTCLSLDSIPSLDDIVTDGSFVRQLQQVQQLDLCWMDCDLIPSEGAEGYCTWQDLASLQDLQQLVLWRCVLPGRLPHAAPVLQRVKQLKVCLLDLPMYEPPTAQQQTQAVQGLLTDAAPNLECLEVEDGVQSTSGIADAAASLAGHTALASLSLISRRHSAQHELAWPGWPLASISRLMRLVLRDLQAVDVSRGLLQDIAACAGLRELHLGLAPGSWSEIGEAHRQQLVALRGQQGGRRCTIEGMGP
jgi:hypothetical protein